MANETGIVGNPYSGGNVALNQTPFTQFYVNTLARQQAKNEAAAKEYQAQAKLLTPTGMRGQDVNALMTAKNEWQSDWYKNKDNILHPDRDNGEAWARNNEYFNKANTIPTVSKDLVKGNQFVSKITSDPVKSRLLTDDAIQRIKLHNLPLDDPRHKSITESEFDSPLFNPKPLSPSEDIALTNLINTKFKGEKVGSKPGVTDLNTFKREDINTYAPKKSELAEILQMGERQYQNGQLAGEVNKIISDHSHGVVNPIYGNLNEVYKKYYGKNIGHPEEAATAILLTKNTNYGDKKEIVTDAAAQKAADEAYWLKHNKITSDQADARARLYWQRQQDKEKEAADVIPKILSGYKTGQTYEGKEGEGLEVYNIPPIIGKKLSKSDTPAFGLGKDGTIYDVQFQKDSNGKTTKIPDWGKTKAIPESQVIAEVQNNNVPSAGKANTMLKNLGNKLGLGAKPQKGTVTFEDNGVEYNIPADKVDAFIKSKPKAKRK